MRGLRTDHKAKENGQGRRKARGSVGRPTASARVRPASEDLTASDLARSIATTSLAFSGNDLSNPGRSAELLEHPAYGRIVREVLDEAERVYSEVLGVGVDLAGRTRAGVISTPETLPEDLATIIAMQVAQVRLLNEVLGSPIEKARSSFGHSLGEISALIVGGVFTLRQLLSIVLGLARDCAELAAETSLAVLCSRDEPVSLSALQRLCLHVNSRGPGLIAPSTYLSPGVVLLLYQGDALDRFEQAMDGLGPMKLSLRRRPGRWPPLHTPLTWQRHVTERAALALYRSEGGFRKPTPPVISCVTGAASYDELNSRDLLIQWTDHPQRLWDVLQEVLCSDTSVIVHVGPEPKLIRSGFARISGAIADPAGHMSLRMMGGYLLSGAKGHSHRLVRLLPSRAALLRAPFVKHVILEDWLLAQPTAG